VQRALKGGGRAAEAGPIVIASLALAGSGQPSSSRQREQHQTGGLMWIPSMAMHPRSAWRPGEAAAHLLLIHERSLRRPQGTEYSHSEAALAARISSDRTVRARKSVQYLCTMAARWGSRG
jgi:hypothetical protein